MSISNISTLQQYQKGGVYMLITTFYKVLVIKVDVFESTIIDERHFNTKAAAQAFIKACNNNNCIAVIITM